MNCKQHNPDGSITSGGKVNTGAALYYTNIPAQRYYTASNCNGYLLRTYGRILIRKKNRRIIMEILDLIEQYKKRLENNQNDYTCLLFALQIPSICSRIEFPQTPENTGRCEDGKLYKSNGNPWDANMYKTWLIEHNVSFVDIYTSSMGLNVFCKAVYDLRCQVTHEGVLMTNESHFYFTNSDNAMCYGTIVFLPMKRLCEDMFDAAMIVLFDKHEKLNITPFKDMFLPDDTYSKIRNDTEKTYKSFWNDYSEDDNMLNCIYDHIIFDKPDMKLKIDEFFKNQSSGTFEIWDFGLKFGYIMDIKQRFIKRRYDESKSTLSRNLKTGSDVLCLSKTEYERMMQVHKELEEFSKSNPFDITKYSERN